MATKEIVETRKFVNPVTAEMYALGATPTPPLVETSKVTKQVTTSEPRVPSDAPESTL